MPKQKGFQKSEKKSEVLDQNCPTLFLMLQSMCFCGRYIVSRISVECWWHSFGVRFSHLLAHPPRMTDGRTARAHAIRPFFPPSLPDTPPRHAVPKSHLGLLENSINLWFVLEHVHDYQQLVSNPS